MRNYYISFGQSHVHRVNNKTFDADSLAMITAEDAGEARRKANSYFGNKWSFIYDDSDVELNYFYRGIIPVE